MRKWWYYWGVFAAFLIGVWAVVAHALFKHSLPVPRFAFEQCVSSQTGPEWGITPGGQWVIECEDLAFGLRHKYELFAIRSATDGPVVVELFSEDDPLIELLWRGECDVVEIRESTCRFRAGAELAVVRECPTADLDPFLRTGNGRQRCVYTSKESVLWPNYLSSSIDRYIGSKSFIAQLSVSPDGTRVAFDLHRHDALDEIAFFTLPMAWSFGLEQYPGIWQRHAEAISNQRFPQIKKRPVMVIDVDSGRTVLQIDIDDETPRHFAYSSDSSQLAVLRQVPKTTSPFGSTDEIAIFDREGRVVTPWTSINEQITSTKLATAEFRANEFEELRFSRESQRIFLAPKDLCSVSGLDSNWFSYEAYIDLANSSCPTLHRSDGYAHLELPYELLMNPERLRDLRDGWESVSLPKYQHWSLMLPRRVLIDRPDFAHVEPSPLPVWLFDALNSARSALGLANTQYHVRLIDLGTGAEISRIPVDQFGDISFSADGRRCVTATGVYDLPLRKNWTLILVLPLAPVGAIGLFCLAVQRINRRLWQYRCSR